MHCKWLCCFWVTWLMSTASGTTTLSSNTTGLLWEGQDSVALFCRTQIADAGYFWELEGEALPEESRYQITGDLSKANSTLTISPIFRNDTGNFTCEAFNSSTTEFSNAVSLNLAWFPVTSVITCGTEAFSDSVRFNCSWAGGNPAANIDLIFNGTTNSGQNSVTRTVTTGTEVQQPQMICRGDQEGRKSECQTNFERPKSTTHSGTVVSSVTEGNNAAMTVSLAQNILLPQFGWYRHNPNLNPINPTDGKFEVESSGSQSTLRISNVTSSEDGTYECRARNVIGSTSFIFRLQVISKGSSGGLSGGAIAGIVIGVLAGVALIGVGGFFLIKKFYLN
ncbi:carcinoembryonic antigen-related cell adhesion molecule 1-like [Hyperolius riggenbachi]|uniref:carcinoembryonic antigen-related cell adhesion molecule 1-like n=1 Tax=Hyperolius riggenbachi TaxID=752182 RepID=UPI0035A2CECF